VLYRLNSNRQNMRVKHRGTEQVCFTVGNNQKRLGRHADFLGWLGSGSDRISTLPGRLALALEILYRKL